MSFREDPATFSLETIPVKSEKVLYCGLWLVLIGINETPPHIILVNDGKYFSLSVRKVDCGSSVEKLISMLSRKNIPSLFIHIESKDSTEKISSLLHTIYKELRPLGNTENTCLSPIKEFFAEYFSRDFSSVNYVFELLALAEKKELLNKCLYMFCKNVINTKTIDISLRKYTSNDVFEKISILSQKYSLKVMP